ncbi:MAG: HD domain-containing protein [Myxococcales bacterium]|nr:HD domain-containing protein [Myxococcales bacterium]
MDSGHYVSAGEPPSALFDAIPPDVIGICQRLRDKGKRGWIVGGCVRDLLRGREAKDWDLATDARPEEVSRFFAKVIPTGLQHGTVTVLIKGKPYEVTTLRGEGEYRDGRRPSEVVFIEDIVQDLARRDFTFNAMAIDPLARTLIDPFDGQRDLAAKVVRAVGVPVERFAEDGLRVLRAARFAASLECEVEPRTLAAMAEPRALATFAKVSVERVHDEWMKTMSAVRPSVAFELMRHSGTLQLSCPELVETVGCEQNKWHGYDVWGHTMAVLDACPPDAVLRLAALFHDVAKPRTREFSDKTGDYTFYGHEVKGAELADTILRRLKASTEDRKRVVHLVRHHLVCYSPEWSDAAVRRFIQRVLPERVEELIVLARADAAGKGRVVEEELAMLEELRVRVATVVAAGMALKVGDLALDGRELMAELGIAPGRLVGEIQRALIELVTDEPEANTRARLLSAARELAARAQ